MQIILLERIANLGQMGDEVKVRDGFAAGRSLLRQGDVRSHGCCDVKEAGPCRVAADVADRDQSPGNR